MLEPLDDPFDPDELVEDPPLDVELPPLPLLLEVLPPELLPLLVPEDEPDDDDPPSSSEFRFSLPTDPQAASIATKPRERTIDFFMGVSFCVKES